jgi:hypothetical protein
MVEREFGAKSLFFSASRILEFLSSRVLEFCQAMQAA